MTEMPGLPAFLALSTSDQRQAYLVGAAELGRSATVLEKDMWVCWTRDGLFRCPDDPSKSRKQCDRDNDQPHELLLRVLP